MATGDAATAMASAQNPFVCSIFSSCPVDWRRQPWLSRKYKTAASPQRPRKLPSSGSIRSQKVVWPDHRPPHMRHRGAVEPQPLRGLGEVPPHHVLELAEVHDDVRIEGVDVVDRD